MLDTNIVSYLFKSHPVVSQHIAISPINTLCISAITEGELRYGLAKRPEAKQLHQVVKEFLKRVDVLPWDSSVSECYGTLRAKLTNQGKSLSSLDLLIAAHALSVNAILITNDKAFSQVPNLKIKDWSMV